MTAAILLACLWVLGLWALIIWATTITAVAKRRSGGWWFLYGLLFGVFALAAIGILPPLPRRD